MEKRQIRIDQGRIIPMFPRLLVTSLSVALLIYLMDQSPKPGSAFFLGLVLSSFIIHIVWSTRKIFVAHQNEARFGHYYWVLGFKARQQMEMGKGVNVAVRRKSKDRKTPGRYPWEVYLILENESEVFVISRDYSKDAEKVAGKIAEKLGVKVKKE